MDEIKQIIQAWHIAKAQNQMAALATVVQVDGSSYRRPGARMLVTENGQLTGAISGGCLEGDALRKAQHAMHTRQNKLVVYNTMDDDAALGLQLGCNGVVYILFEPIIAEEQHNSIHLLQQAVEQRRQCVVCTAFAIRGKEQQGTFLVYCPGKENNLDQNILPGIEHGCRQALLEKRTVVSELLDAEPATQYLFQYLPVTLQLIIAGAGNDAMPVLRLAGIAGYAVTVADGRQTHATKQRFPQAHKVLVCKPDELMSRVETDDRTAFLLMTHNYNYDIALLELLLKTNCRYIGLLGPKKKYQKMLEDLAAKNIYISAAQDENIFAPIGLDLGAETAEEIALSILAEIQMVFKAGSGLPLRQKLKPIHG